jgi:uncharacterized protein (TIGR02284 family)
MSSTPKPPLATAAELLPVLGELHATLLDAGRGFRVAAHEAQERTFALFTALAGKHEDALVRLEALITSLGGEVSSHGTGAAAAHRVWLEVRAWTGDDTALAVECERGENAAKRRFERALAATPLDRMPDAARTTVGRIYEDILDARAELRAYLLAA